MNGASDFSEMDVVRNLALYPSFYCRARLGWMVYPWQEKILDAVGRRGSRVAAKCCNEAGKTSFIVAGLVLWGLETFHNGMIVTTSGSFRQIKDQLYPRVQGLAGRLGKHIEVGDGWARNLETGTKLVSFSTNDPGKAEGWHEPVRPVPLVELWSPEMGIARDAYREMVGDYNQTNLLMIMDEAKTPPIEIHEAFERCHPSMWLNCSSPGDPMGPFFDCFHSAGERWEQFTVRAMDCPHLWENPAKRAELEAQMRTLRAPLIQSMIYAEFPDSGEMMLFDMKAVLRACEGQNAHWGKGFYRRAALDISMGGDAQTLWMCDGNYAWCEWRGNETDDHRLVSIVIERLQRKGFKPHEVIADDGGVGQVVLNEFARRGWPIERFNFGAAARNPKLYRNRRAEIYTDLADNFRSGAVNVENNEMLRTELSWQKYDSLERPYKLVSKKGFPWSPNEADALAMLFSDLPAPADVARMTRANERRFSLTAGSEVFEEEEGGGSLYGY